MKTVVLGETGIEVSRLCFGTLTMGPLQRNMPLNRGVALLELAFSFGLNFVDTAELYGTYPYIKEAIKLKNDLVVCTKSYSYDKKSAEDSFKAAVAGIGRDYIDIFLLHEQESEHTIRGHWEAVEYFLEKKRQGYIGAVGLSTHYIAAIVGALTKTELQILFPLINKTGIGIADGTSNEMLEAIRRANRNGKGILAMKALGGGHLLHIKNEALCFVMEEGSIHSIAIGMQTAEEVRYNCALFSDMIPSKELEFALNSQPRKLMIHDWCEGCGACVKRCRNKALSLEGGKAAVDSTLCVLCGYCASVCPQFCLKVI